MDSGELLPDDLIMEMVAERLAERDARARGFILDGCPRTTPQAEAAGRRSLAPVGLDLVIDIEVPTEPVLRRLACAAGLRRLRGQLLDVAAPPMVNWTCDVCGGEVIQREDDTEEAIERRLELYERADRPAHRLVPRRAASWPRSAGTGSPDAVTRRVDPGRRRTGASGRRRGTPMRRNDEEIAKMRRAGRVVAEMHEATRAAAKPGVTTAELDAVAREVLERRGAPVQLPRLPRLPGRDLHLAQRHDRPRHPRRLRARGGRHPLHRLRGDHRGLPRRRRLHHGRSGRSRPRPQS